MKKYIWLTLGALVLAACSQPTPKQVGETVKKGEEKTITAGSDGELKIDKGKLANDAIISVGKVTAPTPPANSNISGGFTALRVNTGSIALRPTVSKQETTTPELFCESGFTLKITYPADTQNAAKLRMYRTGNPWVKLTPTVVNLEKHYVLGCMASDALNVGQDAIYTLGIPLTGLKVSGGTSQETVNAGGVLEQRNYTAFRLLWIAPEQASRQAINVNPMVKITGPAGWNDNQVYQVGLNPALSKTLTFAADVPAVTGTYNYSYFDGATEHTGSFNIDSTQKLARATGFAVTPVATQNATFNFHWNAPAGADLASQQSSVTLLGSETSAALDTKTGPADKVLTIPNFDPLASYAFCVFAWSKDPISTPFDQQVNESRGCYTYTSNN